jgi:glyoxylase-like metal-dependent hydrolase (beta-lactamase superfamily II)
VGRQQVVLIDPGPDVDHHIRALCHALEPAEEIRILLTHGHSDHAGGASALVEKTGGALMAPFGYKKPEGSSVSVHPLSDGDRVPTDQGDLVVVETPGHSRDHLAIQWPEADAVFVGDLLLGRGNTTWVGEYLGCVKDYLASLEKIRELDSSILYPTHGPPIQEPLVALNRYRRHRLERLRQVEETRTGHPHADPRELAELIYGGEIPEKLQKAALSAVEAALYHLDGEGQPT